MPVQARRYAVAPGLLLLDWGESTAAVYVPHSASTHQISGDAAALLQACMEAPLQEAEVQAAGAGEIIQSLLNIGLMTPLE